MELALVPNSTSCHPIACESLNTVTIVMGQPSSTAETSLPTTSPLGWRGGRGDLFLIAAAVMTLSVVCDSQRYIAVIRIGFHARHTPRTHAFTRASGLDTVMVNCPVQDVRSGCPEALACSNPVAVKVACSPWRMNPPLPSTISGMPRSG